MTAGIFEER